MTETVSMALAELVRKAEQLGDVDFLREGVRVLSRALMEAEVPHLGAERRVPELPDVRTVAKAGYPELNVIGWQGIDGPPGLPTEIAQFWTDDPRRAGEDPELARRATKVGKVPAVLADPEVERWLVDPYQNFLPLATTLDIRQ